MTKREIQRQETGQSAHPVPSRLSCHGFAGRRVRCMIGAALILGAASPPHPARAQGLATLSAPTPDSLAHLVMARFATSPPDSFDSVYVDPLGREVVRTAVQQRSL